MSEECTAPHTDLPVCEVRCECCLAPLRDKPPEGASKQSAKKRNTLRERTSPSSPPKKTKSETPRRLRCSKRFLKSQGAKTETARRRDQEGTHESGNQCDHELHSEHLQYNKMCSPRNLWKDNEDCVMHSWWGQQQARVHSRDVCTFIDNLWIQRPTRLTCECRFAQKSRGDKMTAQVRSDGLLERELELLLKSFMRCSASRHQRELHLRIIGFDEHGC